MNTKHGNSEICEITWQTTSEVDERRFTARSLDSSAKPPSGTSYLVTQLTPSSSVWIQLLLQGWPSDYVITVPQTLAARIVPRLRIQSQARSPASPWQVSRKMLSPDCVLIPVPSSLAPGHNLLSGLPAIVPGTVLGTSYVLTQFLLPTTPALQMKELKHQEIELLVKDHTLAKGQSWDFTLGTVCLLSPCS